ncbi:hypothetical protein E2562_023908 [Oryza meyeriana var. granulata]|uniref:Uncharacterized protein n=1 Tax=Oryza meyeriana var. granulata TaxID=110450 RepID=A0A6G1BZF2_9ORYZ|nr:hypothetical protein E2562_023908 [Oryza meyeriana var. granulata]
MAIDHPCRPTGVKCPHRTSRRPRPQKRRSASAVHPVRIRPHQSIEAMAGRASGAAGPWRARRRGSERGGVVARGNADARGHDGIECARWAGARRADERGGSPRHRRKHVSASCAVGAPPARCSHTGGQGPHGYYWA